MIIRTLRGQEFGLLPARQYHWTAVEQGVEWIGLAVGVLRSLHHDRTVRVAIMAHDDRLACGEDLPAPPEMIAHHQESVARADSMPL